MTIAQTGEPTPRRPLRLWPGVVIVVIQWLARFVLPLVIPESVPYAFIGTLILGVGILIWWAFFSRAPGADRWIAVLLMIVTVFVTAPVSLGVGVPMNMKGAVGQATPAPPTPSSHTAMRRVRPRV